MSHIARRGSLAAAAAIAVVLAGATGASAAATPNDDAPAPVTKSTVERLSGDTRARTAIDAAQNQFPTEALDKGVTGTSAAGVIIARQDDFADALTASTLADSWNLPILTTKSGELYADVAAEVQRLAAGAAGKEFNVYIVGGENAVTPAVKDALEALKVDTAAATGSTGNVERYAGKDRYETAVKIADLVYPTVSDGPLVYLADGTDFADALSAGTIAAQTNGIVLLTNHDELDEYTVKGGLGGEDTTASYTGKYLEEYLNEAGTAYSEKVVAIGGPAADAVDGKVLAAQEIVGTDRYDTALKGLKKYFVNGTNVTDQIAVASGVTAADAVVASAYIANHDGALLLTLPGDVHDDATKLLSDATVSGNFFDIKVFGGPAAIGDAAVNELVTATKATLVK
ncbi:cell wall-binding repeat-containing protein [Georgenia sp. SYP-B2076]|uniref:cell wall-binding repeat-containing protein n=1 Tax=Georgenia sp. SYP-B2076 TaxID=2495881 RepID=UPI000F8DA77D|nr:cell wall-binding repeat-containing protein [Georgenia sp. SYP-B2076]